MCNRLGIHGPNKPIQDYHQPNQVQQRFAKANYNGHTVQQTSHVKVTVTAYDDHGLKNKTNKSLAQRRAQRTDKLKNSQLQREAYTQGLPSRNQLIKTAGRPKADSKWLGFITYKHSTGYNAILKALDSYHELASNHQSDLSPRDQLNDLEDRLNTLSKAVDRYLKKSSHTRTSAITGLQNKINSELAMVRQLNKTIGKGTVYADWPADLTLDTVLQAAKKDMNAPRYLATGFSKAETALLIQNGLSIQDGLAYRDVGLEITPETMPGTLKNNLAEPLEKLGKGSFNTVFKATANTIDGPTAVAFKPLDPLDELGDDGFGWSAAEIGISQKNPQFAQRNLVTHAVAKELGFDVVAKTEIGIADGRPGIVMELAPKDRQGSKLKPEDLNDPEVRRELTKLQLLDAILGQGDRHRGNYFVVRHPKVRVVAIDNDQCCGSRISDPNDMAYSNDAAHRGFRG